MKSPQLVSQIQNLMNSKVDPNELFTQIMKDKTPKEMEGFYKFAKSYGVNDEVLSKLQNGMNVK